MNGFFVICGLLASTVYGHMQMSKPYPIRSPLNPNGGDNKDYSYTTPLSPSGSDYPCKGYANDPFVSVATYTAGQTYDLELAGSATHGGGSCQISLSYDKGKSFTVIESIEGGCPIAKNYTFTIPSDAPTGEALLAWTWFNKIGNREMYMNCAQVTVNGPSKKRSHARDFLRNEVAFSSRPPIFLANINAEGQCTTTANEEVKFPLPGPDVVGSVNTTGFTCKKPAPFLGSSSPSSTSSVSSASSATLSSTSAAPTSTSSPDLSAAISSALSALSSALSSASHGPTAISTAPSFTSSATPSSTSSTSSSASFSTSATPVSTASANLSADLSSELSSALSSALASAFSSFLPPVTAGPASPVWSSASPSHDAASSSAAAHPSSSPKMPSASAVPRIFPIGPCKDGEIGCSPDGKSFSICNHHAWTHMGRVAAGTICKDGSIQRSM